MQIKLLLSGDGGQGVQLVADIICAAAFNAGHFVSFIPNYGLEQRGGVSLAFITVSDKEISFAKFFRPDVMLILSDQADMRTERYQTKNIKILNIKNYSDIFKQNNIAPRGYNIFFLGILAEFLEETKIVKAADIFILLEKKLGKKDEWEENKRAFEIGKNIKY